MLVKECAATMAYLLLLAANTLLHSIVPTCIGGWLYGWVDCFGTVL